MLSCSAGVNCVSIPTCHRTREWLRKKKKEQQVAEPLSEKSKLWRTNTEGPKQKKEREQFRKAKEMQDDWKKVKRDKFENQDSEQEPKERAIEAKKSSNVRASV